MDAANTLVASTALAAVIAALVLALSHDRLPQNWHVTGNYAYGSAVCLIAFSAVVAINGLGWQWIVVAWLMWTVPGTAVVALYVQDEAEREKRKKQRETEDEQPETSVN